MSTTWDGGISCMCHNAMNKKYNDTYNGCMSNKGNDIIGSFKIHLFL